MNGRKIRSTCYYTKTQTTSVSLEAAALRVKEGFCPIRNCRFMTQPSHSLKAERRLEQRDARAANARLSARTSRETGTVL
ncbi:hypothetical protein GN956_G788 [Arapaima gigas]